MARPPRRPICCARSPASRRCRPHVTASVRVGDRRWNIELDNGIDVALPEKNAESAWHHLAALDRSDKLLARNVQVIDMRLPDRVVLRVPPDIAKSTIKKGTGRASESEHMTKMIFARAAGCVAAVDIGTTKSAASSRGSRTASRTSSASAIRSSSGVRNGVIVDIEAASRSILDRVHAAEEMAGETISEVVINVSGGFSASRLVKSRSPSTAARSATATAARRSITATA